MAPIKYLAAAGMTVLLGSFTIGAEAEAVTADATQICVSSINKARAARLDTRGGVLKPKSNAASEITAVLAALTNKGENATCALDPKSIPTHASVSGFVTSFSKANKDLTDADCDAVVQSVITGALTQIGTDETKPFKANTAPYVDANVAAQNFGYIMDDKATEIACAVTTNCKDNKSILVCRMYPAINTTTGVVPFTSAFYSAVKARADSGIKIGDLTDADIGTSLSGSNSAQAIVPAAALIVSVLSLLNL